MDYQSLWGVHPWAQVSYNQSLASDAWRRTARRRAPGVMSPWAPICRSIACCGLGGAIAGGQRPIGANYLYLMGVSANF
jgi:hypothetical protein